MIDREPLRAAVAGDAFWEPYLTNADVRPIGLHLAIFVEPLLRYVLDGRKTVEARFSVHRAAPYGLVDSGDIVLLKASGGPVVGICRVTHAWYYRLGAAAWQEIRERFGPALALADDSALLAAHHRAAFATLLQLADVRRVAPLPAAKHDRRGWVVLRSAQEPPMLPGLEGTW